MLDWFWEEASGQLGDTCSGPFYDPPSNSTSKEGSRKQTFRGRFKSFRSFESDEDDDSSADSSKDSISAPSTTSKLRQQARKLTKRILQREPSEYDADESTFGNENSSMHSSGPSYYFQSLNDRRRSQALFSEESTIDNHISDDKSDVESGKTCDSSVDNTSSDPRRSKMEKEEVRKKNKLLWIKNQFSNNGNEELEQQESDEDEARPTESPEKLEELKKVAKEREEKRFRKFSVFAIPLLILGMAGLGLYLGLTWNNDAPRYNIEDAGAAIGSEGPTLVFSPLDGDMSSFTQNDAPWLDEESEVTEPPGDEDLIKKHLEAYEAWKASNSFRDEDDDNYASVDVDFSFGLDETISLQRTNGND